MRLKPFHTASQTISRAPEWGVSLSWYRANAHLVVLAATVVAGLFPRLYTIDSRELWPDEAVRVLAARLPGLLDVVHGVWAQPPSAPLYWLGLHWWIQLFGHSDVTVRLFSVLPSLGGLLATYRLGKMAGGRAAGLVAAGLLSISPLAVEVGQEATMYSLSLLLATLALAQALAWLQRGRGARGYVVLAVLLLYTHYMGALLLALVMSTGIMWQFRANKPVALSTQHPVPDTSNRWAIKRWLLMHVVIGLLWSPWLIAMLVRVAERWGELSRLHHTAGLSELYTSFAQLSVSAGAYAHWSPGWVTLAVATGGCLLALALWSGAPSIRGNIAWLLSVAVAYVGLIVGISALTGAWLFNPRFVTLALPALLAVMAVGVTTLCQATLKSRRNRVVGTTSEVSASERPHGASFFGYTPAVGVWLLLGSWVVAQGGGLWEFYTEPVHGHTSVREAAVWLSGTAQSGDLVVSNHPLLLWSLAQYYDGPTRGLPESWDVRNGYPLLIPEQPAWVQSQWAVLPGLAANTRHLWLIYLPVVDPDGWLLSHIRQHYKQQEARVYPYATVYMFEGR